MYNLNELYPAINNRTYLNTAAHGLISTTNVAYKSALNDQFLKEASDFTDQSDVFLNNVRKTLSQFLNSDFHVTALVPNFSFAFNTLLDAIDPNKKFLLVQNDYPSMNTAVELRGFNRCYAALDADLEKNIWQACEQHTPDFLALSIVQYISGIKIDLDFLKDLKVQFPKLIIVADGTQFVGVEEFGFRESGIDILAASCYKWLNAGRGNGFMVFKEEVVEHIKPCFIELLSTREFTNDRGTFIGSYEPGHLDMVTYGGLQHAIEFVNDYGLDRVQNKIQDLAVQAKNELSKRDRLDKAVVYRKHHSSILNVAGDAQLMRSLKDQNVIVSQRGNGLRVSFSYFNTVADLHHLLDVIDA